MAIVLIIDGDESLRVAIEKTLAREGHRALGAASGQEGLDLLTTEPVDVVLTDRKSDSA